MREFSYQCPDCNGSTLSFDKYKDEYFCVRCPYKVKKERAEKLTQTNPEYKIGFSTAYDYTGSSLVLNIESIKDPQLKRKLKRSIKKDKLKESVSLEKAASIKAEKAARKSLRKQKDAGIISSPDSTQTHTTSAAGKRASILTEKQMRAEIRKILAARKLDQNKNNIKLK